MVDHVYDWAIIHVQTQEYISNPKATSTLIKMLKASHSETSAGLSLLPLMDEENSDSADYRLGDASSNITSTLLEREASNIVNQIRKSSDIADFIRDMGYGCTTTVEKFREAVKVSGYAADMSNHKDYALTYFCLGAFPPLSLSPSLFILKIGIWNSDGRAASRFASLSCVLQPSRSCE